MPGVDIGPETFQRLPGREAHRQNRNRDIRPVERNPVRQADPVFIRKSVAAVQIDDLPALDPRKSAVHSKFVDPASDQRIDRARQVRTVHRILSDPDQAEGRLEIAVSGFGQISGLHQVRRDPRQRARIDSEPAAQFLEGNRLRRSCDRFKHLKGFFQQFIFHPHSVSCNFRKDNPFLPGLQADSLFRNENFNFNIIISHYDISIF